MVQSNPSRNLPDTDFRNEPKFASGPQMLIW